MNTLTIIIANYNSKKYLENCLRSLVCVAGFKEQIIVVDNSSKDSSQQMIKNKFPKVKLIENKTNLGFSRANNLASQEATTKYLLFLNPDTVVLKDTLAKLIQTANRINDLGALGCKILNADNSLQFSCGCFPTLYNVILDRMPILRNVFYTELIRKRSYYQKRQSPDWVSGVCLLVPKDLFDKVGGFDENFFLYVEEVDLCYRIRKKGLKTFYTPESQIIHHYQGGQERRKDKKSDYMRQGLVRFFKKHRPRWEHRVLIQLTRFF